MLLLSSAVVQTRNGEMKPNARLLSDLLYENPYGGQLWMLYNANKQLISCGDAYPKSYSVKLEKGEYTLKLQVTHNFLLNWICVPLMIVELPLIHAGTSLQYVIT